jgi:hypothetical protein
VPDFRIVQTPRQPGHCLICGADNVILVEMVPELWLEGHGYVMVCADNDVNRSGCAVQMARLTGCLGEGECDKLFADLLAAQERVSALEAELALVKRPVVISQDEYQRLLGAPVSES